MKVVVLALFALSHVSWALAAEESSVVDDIRKWQAQREEQLRADNGWLTLAGRFPLKEGANTFGTGRENDVVFPAALAGTGSATLGTLHVDAPAKRVVLKLADGVTMTSDGKPFTGERVLGTPADRRDWVALGRISMHLIERGGKYILRLADNESLVRKNFPGCVWYPSNATLQVKARFVAYAEGKSLPIVNIIDETTQQPSPGYAEFQFGGETCKLDAIASGEGLFFIFRDGTAGDTTYPPGRFLDVEKRPKDNEVFTLDFNRAYSPPCAFSEFTTCPLPPRQNILKARIEAGEKAPAKR
jgi:uncharacterized protein (DUF1684 family)